MKYIKHILIAALAMVFIGCAKQPPMPTVSNFDINAYMGEWYEIAKYPNPFQKGCPLAKARYSLQKDHVKVTNICMDEQENELRRAEGEANIIEAGKLEVSFFKPFYGDYWVIMLADDYRYSVVGDPKRKYLWILSRQQIMTPEDIDQIVNNLESFGYDKSKLVWNKY